MKKFVIDILNPIRNNCLKKRQACLGDQRLRGGWPPCGAGDDKTVA
jgi:hypothetical protein